VDPALKIINPPCVLYGSEPAPPTNKVSPAGISVIGAAVTTPAQHKETATIVAVAKNERLEFFITISLFSLVKFIEQILHHNVSCDKSHP
jgi:hypothetical protein